MMMNEESLELLLNDDDLSLEDKELIVELNNDNKLDINFLPFLTYDLEQVGYPYPNKGVMIPRPYSGSNENGELLSGNGEWVRLSTVLKLLKNIKQ